MAALFRPHAAAGPWSARAHPMLSPAESPPTGAKALRPVAIVVLVCLLFAASGSVGLIYEVVWKDIFTLVFGNTTYAISVVISVFMAGLALGSFVFGRLADRARRHLLIYALLELGIAASALLVPQALHHAEALYRLVFRATQSPALLTAVQVVVSAGILLVPTFLMGGTLPVLSRFIAALRGQVGPSVGILYGLNTLGAAAGAFITGFVLIKDLGTLSTIYLAASANFALAAAFLLLRRLSRAEQAAADAGSLAGGVLPAQPAPEADMGAGRRRLLLAAVAMSGFVAFSYEVLWTRLLTFKFGATVYAFSTMLGTFLLGLGLGGAALGLLKRAPAKARYWRVFGYLEAGVGLSGLAGMLLFFSASPGYSSFAQRALDEFGTSALVMLVPTMLMGAAFPIACHLFAAGVQETGRSVGRMYVVNTAGAVLGSLLTGFWLVKSLGTQGSLTLASFLMLGSAMAVLAWSPAAAEDIKTRRGALRGLRPLPIVAGAAVIIWVATPRDFLVGYFLRNQTVAVVNPGKRVSLLGYAEGVDGVVVACQLEGSHKTIASGSTDVAGTSYILRNTQKLQAHIPMLVHPDPRDVCQVGFGSGETARIFASYDVERFDCIEISRAMLDVADKTFKDINEGVLEGGRIHMVLMDAAVYLRYTDRKYDVIANDATWPSLAGPAMLYTLEYFRNGRAHLKPGGIMTSWLPLDIPVQDIRTVLRTFHEVFPHVYVWTTLSHRNKHALLIGSDQPLRIDARRFLDRFERFARKDLEPVYLGDPAAFLTCHLSKVEGAADDLADAPLSTDYSPALKFMHSRIYRQPRLLAGSLGVLRGHRDSILGHLTGVEALPSAKEFTAKLVRLDSANDHILNALMAPSQDAGRGATEYALALRLGPELPARYLAAEDREEVAAITPEQLRALPLPELKERARRLVQHAVYEKALAALEMWAAREPASAEPFTAMGTCYMLMREPAGAIPYLARAVQLDPESPEAQFGLGAAYVRVGEARKAIPYLERAAALSPDSPDAHAFLGTAYGLTGDAALCLLHLRRAVELNPDLPDAQRNLGILLMKQGQPAEAIAHLEKALEGWPDAAEIHGLLAQAYRQTGNQEAADRHLQQAKALSSSPKPAL